VLPFHRDIVNNPAFAPEGDEPFSIYTRWIETEYDNQIEPWSGEIAESNGPDARTSVVVEVAGRRVEVTLPKRLAGGASAAHTAGAAPRRRTAAHSVSTATGDAVKAPMQATVVKVAVVEGDKVVKGDLVLVLEAMKMEQPILAHKDGVVGLVNAEAGATVSSGHLLLAINDA
jgi:acetyl-CoA/propionyl-CoA carboxylase biotin carboxyl carrier protein